MKKILLFVAVLLICVQFLSADAKLDSIRAAIKASGAKWEAGITSMSILTEEEQKLRLGWLKELDVPPDERGLPKTVKPSRTQPESLDWRNYNGVDYTTTIKDQGACGSCVCFGTLGALEAMMNIQADIENPYTDMSEQELLSCSPASCNGWNTNDAMNWLKYFGVSEEACFPYQANDNIPCSERCDRYEFTKRRVDQWGWAYSYVWGIKEAVEDGPISVAFDVYEDFNYYTGGVYTHEWGEYQGGHCVTLVGWNNADSCWIVKNSWGGNWGEDGYFRIKWGECNIENWGAWLTVNPAGYPYIVLLNTIVDDAVGGDGDGVLNPGEEGDLIIEIKNEPGWTDAEYVEAVLRSQDPRISIIDSTADYGNILAGDSADNISDPFVVQGISGDSLAAVSMTLYVTAVGDSGAYWIDLDFELEYGWMQNGWPSLSEQVKTSPAIKDLNDDFMGEVVYGSEEGNLFVRNAWGENYSSFPYHVANKIWGSPAVGDVDNDGEIDIVFTGFNGNIYCLDRYGGLKWSVPTGGPVIATPALSDVDNDNTLEIIVGSFDKKLYVLKYDGSPFNANFPMDIPDGTMITCGCAVGDINGDYTREIVVASYGGNVYAISTDGSVLYGWPFYTGGNIWSAPSIANLDGTGVKTAVGSTNDTMYVINDDGTLDWKVATSGEVRSSPSFADIDGDGNLEMFFGSGDQYVYGYDHTGIPLAGWPIDLGSSIETQVVFSDLNNDNFPEIVVTTKDEIIYVFDKDGNSFDIFPQPIADLATTPAIEDIDNDGDLEIFFGNVNGVSAIDYKEARGYGTYWNMFRCNPRRTGNYEDAESGIEESTVLKPSIFKVYPNPFRDHTVVVFSCEKNQRVDIDIYNVAGQRVKSIESRGETTVRVFTWNGRDEKNKAVPTGVYFCRLKTDNGTKFTKKLVKIE